MVWSYYLEKFRRCGIPTKFDTRTKKEEILEGKKTLSRPIYDIWI